MFFESASKGHGGIHEPVELMSPFCLIIEVHWFCQKNSACLFIGQFSPIKGYSDFGFDQFAVGQQGLEQSFIVVDIQLYDKAAILSNKVH